MTTVSRLDGWPICSPADASLTSSRTPAHGSGPMWVATPSSQWTFTAHSRGHLYVTCYTEGFSHFVTSMTAPVASGWSGWPGGACTHWKAPPCHGAHVKRTLQVVAGTWRFGGKLPVPPDAIAKAI